ncbi:helix-turn-helix transcriptional regulator [Enterovibrio coralii]|uniref:DNA-binding transcriptional regulator n=1 Tax=Enterovibrio coralii TaxID=294935 RepID=A0A135I8C7_9GAMM|nr:YafY family protein [Enterovibrio coralii]KXF81695.1 DNA-binding transcriptional regulator [Enterovibrio coralii]
MSKSERLFELLTLLRSKRYAVTAKALAEELSVSERTIYRDIQSLQLSGVPIEGEAGIGYLLGKGSHLPPLMFTEEEMLALELGMQMVRAWSDKCLSAASESASRKIHSVLPDHLKAQLECFPLAVPPFFVESDTATCSELLREATSLKRKIEIEYETGEGVCTSRVIQPLGQVYWGKVWTLVAWCELREDYRSFRVDRIQRATMMENGFELTDAKNFQHYMSRCHEAENESKAKFGS